MKLVFLFASVFAWAFLYFVFSVYNKSFDYKAWSQDSAGMWAFAMIFVTLVAIIGLVVDIQTNQSKPRS